MKKNRKPYLDYYKKYNISPVLSKVNLKFHSNQRIFLYTKLGITPSSIKNKKIKLSHFDKIAPWWGRGLQYVAFIKK